MYSRTGSVLRRSVHADALHPAAHAEQVVADQQRADGAADRTEQEEAGGTGSGAGRRDIRRAMTALSRKIKPDSDKHGLSLSPA
jgi:IS5 family transposase